MQVADHNDDKNYVKVLL